MIMAKLTEQDILNWNGPEDDYMNSDQLAFFREQSSKLAPALGVNYIVEADEQTALQKAEEALKVV